MNLKRFIRYLPFVVVLICGCQKNISGSYISVDDGGVIWLQVVRTPDSHLTGQLSLDILKPDGTIDRKSSTFSGAVDGENVTLTTEGLFGLKAATLSGTFAGDTLTFYSGQPVPIVLTGVKRETPLTDVMVRGVSRFSY